MEHYTALVPCYHVGGVHAEHQGLGEGAVPQLGEGGGPHHVGLVQAQVGCNM